MPAPTETRIAEFVADLPASKLAFHLEQYRGFAASCRSRGLTVQAENHDAWVRAVEARLQELVTTESGT